MLRLLSALLLLVPATATPSAEPPADERRVNLGSFEKLRVNGAFDISVTTGASPGATVIADRGAIADIDLRTEGATLTVRRNIVGRWSEQGQGVATAPVKIVITTPRLSSIVIVGGSKITVSRLTGTRIDLSIAGNGTIAAGAVEGDQLNAQLIGEGRIGVAGRVANARLLANGSGTIDAAALEAGDLKAHLDGPGTIAARARFTAQVSSTGLGTITVAGRPKCRVTASAGAPVTCGTGQ